MEFQFFRPFSMLEQLNGLHRELMGHLDSIPAMTDHLRGMDVIEDKETVKLLLDVPGIKREDIKVQLKEGLLIIKGNRPKVENAIFRSRPAMEINYSFNLSEELDHSKVSARCIDGVLEITLQKKPSNSTDIKVE